MYERHEHEQYFWDAATVSHLADVVSPYPNPCCLCAPRLGHELERRGVQARTLDVDERFAGLRGFRRWDLYRPEWLGEQYGIIVCDPPFFNASLSQLFTAIRLLSRHDYMQPLLLCYLARRSANVLGTFWRFGLEPTGYEPDYVTVQDSDRNRIEFFGNLGREANARLRGEEDMPEQEDVVTLYRPVGQKELDLIRESGWRTWPPRLPFQPIFYPVLNEEYATQIARDWNTKDAASDYVGYVTRFQVRVDYLRRYPVQTVGGAQHQEYWIPAEDLEEFNHNIVGMIEVIAGFRPN